MTSWFVPPIVVPVQLAVRIAAGAVFRAYG